MKYLTTIFISLLIISCAGFSSPEKKEWDKPFTAESRKNVNNWLNALLVKYFAASIEGNTEEMLRIQEDIRILLHLEYSSNMQNQ